MAATPARAAPTTTSGRCAVAPTPVTGAPPRSVGLVPGQGPHVGAATPRRQESPRWWPAPAPDRLDSVPQCDAGCVASAADRRRWRPARQQGRAARTRGTVWSAWRGPARFPLSQATVRRAMAHAVDVPSPAWVTGPAGRPTAGTGGPGG